MRRRRASATTNVLDDESLARTVDLVRFLEASGMACAWIADSPPLLWPDVYVTMGLCAGATSRITLAPGVTFTLRGDANDYTGKGLSGGRLIVRQPPQARRDPAA